MKRLFLLLSLLFIVLLNSYSYAGDSTPVLIRDACPANTCDEIEEGQLQLANMNFGITGGNVPAAGGAGCNPGMGDNVGDDLGDQQIPSPRMYCRASTALCSGTLGTLYIKRTDTDAVNWHGCVYNKVNADPDAGSNTLVACGSSEADSGTAGWVSNVIGSGSITASNEYYLCVAVEDGSSITMESAASGGNDLVYLTGTDVGCNDDPATMNTDCTWGSAGGDEEFNIYVTIE